MKIPNKILHATWFPDWLRNFIYNTRSKMNEGIYDGESIPSTLAEAISRIIAEQDEEAIEYIKNQPPHGQHHSFGMNLRNNWGLWGKDSPLVKWFNEIGIVHADDMSGIILDAVWAKVRGEEFDLNAKVKFYHDYWRKMGLDPITMEKIGPAPRRMQIDPETREITILEYDDDAV